MGNINHDIHSFSREVTDLKKEVEAQRKDIAEFKKIPSFSKEMEDSRNKKLEEIAKKFKEKVNEVEEIFQATLKGIRAAIREQKKAIANSQSPEELAKLEADLRLLEARRDLLKKELININESKKYYQDLKTSFFTKVGYASLFYTFLRGLWDIVEDSLEFAGTILRETAKAVPILKAVMGVVFNTLGWIESWFPAKWNVANKLRLFNATVGALVSYAVLALVLNPVTFPVGITLFLASSVVDLAVNSYLLSIALDKRQQARAEFNRAEKTYNHFLETFKGEYETLKVEYKKENKRLPTFSEFIKAKEESVLANPSDEVKDFCMHYENYLSAKAKLEKAETHVAQKGWAFGNSLAGLVAIVALTVLSIAALATPVGLGLTIAAFAIVSAITVVNIGKKIIDRFKARKETKNAQSKLDELHKNENALEDKLELQCKAKTLMQSSVLPQSTAAIGRRVPLSVEAVSLEDRQPLLGGELGKGAHLARGSFLDSKRGEEGPASSDVSFPPIRPTTGSP